MSEHIQNDATPDPITGKTVRANGSVPHDVEMETDAGRGNLPPTPPPSASTASEQPKKRGLTLESLKRATSNGSAVPLAAIVSQPVTIEVRKPTKGVPFQAHTNLDFTTHGYSMVVRTPNVIGETVYLVDPPIAELVPAHIRYQMFALCFDAWQRTPFIWPITVPVEGGRTNSWTTSAMRIWGAAQRDWVCLIPGGGAYALHKPIVPISGNPVWPKKPFHELMIMAFGDLFIEDEDHPEIVKRLTSLVPDDE